MKTARGKTIIIARLTHYFNTSTLILCHNIRNAHRTAERIKDIVEQQNSFAVTDPYIKFERVYGHNEFTKPPQYIRETPKVYNNSPCTCGSGKKFKKCCKA
jgi:uncharacterized protein YchJ